MRNEWSSGRRLWVLLFVIIKICVCVHYKVCESVILGMCNRGLRHACSAPNGKSHAVIISVIILHIMYHCLMLATHRVYSSHCTSYCTVLASIVPCRQTVVWPECVGGISSEISNCPSMGEGKPMQLDSISPTVSMHYKGQLATSCNDRCLI